MSRHDNYKEGCWAVWLRHDTYADNAADYCWDTPEEAQEHLNDNTKDPKHFRLVRLHRVTVDDVFAEAHYSPNIWGIATAIEDTMAKLGVALTERWVAAETREIEPAAKVPDLTGRRLSVGELAQYLAEPDPLLSRLLAAWEKLTPYRRARTAEYAEALLRELNEIT